MFKSCFCVFFLCILEFLERVSAEAVGVTPVSGVERVLHEQSFLV